MLEMDALRSTAHFTRADRVRNEDIRQLMELQETVEATVKRDSVWWYDHVQRMAEDRLFKVVMKRTLHHKKELDIKNLSARELSE